MDKIFDITSFGAKPQTEQPQTKAIQAAVNACMEAGGGTVVVPEGVFVSGMIRLGSYVHLQLKKGAVLAASLDYNDFPLIAPVEGSRSHKDRGFWSSLLFAVHAKDLAVTGEGLIDGRGKGRSGRIEEIDSDCDGRVRNILFIDCSDIRIEGISMQNSGLWNQHYLNCENLVVSHISVYNHANRNNDGIDIDGCRNVLVTDSVFDTDDDGIVIKSTGPAGCDGVTVRNCTVSSFANPIKCGTESSGGYRNVHISNCRVRPPQLRPGDASIIIHTESGIAAIALEAVDGGPLENVVVKDIDIQGTLCPIFIRLGNRARRYAPEAPEPGLSSLTNVLLENITASECGTYCASITGIKSRNIGRVELRNIKLKLEGGITSADARGKCPVNGYDAVPEERHQFIADLKHVNDDADSYPEALIWGNLPSSGMFIRHADDVILTDCTFDSNSPDARIPVIAADVKRLTLKKITSTSPSPVKVQLYHVGAYEIDDGLPAEILS